MITDIEEYFASGCGRCARFATPDCATRIWQDTLSALRALCREAGLEETVKWGHPCYRHAGRNIAIIGALRGEVRLSFFEPALMSDPEGVLLRQGPNARNPDMIRLRATGDVARLAPVIRAYLVEAMGHAAAGIRAPAGVALRALPAELLEALDADPQLAEAFHALTPGRRNSYVIHLNGARTSATRMARIAKARDRILAGRGATER